ncbi:MAG: hypothetical protein ABSF70_10725 [Terracidiphilus sp.]|jgi:hypothetical protein
MRSIAENTRSLKAFAVLLAGGFVLSWAELGAAQTAANVQVEVTKPINVMTLEAIGVYTDMYDARVTQPVIAQYLHATGIYTVRYPGGGGEGGYGSYPDLYHWATNSGTYYQNFKPEKTRFYAGENSMGHLAQFLDKLGTAVITVNYGSNAAGTGGGEPAEAAAWVAYANGDPNDARVIGKDSTGQDWKTIGYWATLRSQASLPDDDGLNLLRANHPKPLGIKLWEIGSEVYKNGYYYGDYYGDHHDSEEDLHAPYPASEKDNARRKKNPNLSPAFYGARVVEYAKAMKAVDPAIWIGASMALAPLDYHFAPDWDSEVLKAACGSIDFISLAWRPGDTLAPDYKVRDDDSVLRAPEEQLGKIFPEIVYNNKKYCPADHSPRVAFTQVAPIQWPKIEHPIVDALFAADAFALLVESGTINSDWMELHDPSFLNENNQPGRGYYGIQMLHIVAFRPGDKFVAATSNNSALAVHAIQRSDGSLGILLINKDGKNAVDVKVKIAGGSYASTGLRFDYGQETLKAGGPIAKSPVKDLGAAFTVSVPAYSLTDIVIPKAQ